MFDNIGSKIKIVAIVCTIVGIVASVIAGIVLMAGDVVGLGLLVAVGGSFLSWVGSFLLYGFGELITSVNALSSTTMEIYMRLSAIEKRFPVQAQAPQAPKNQETKPVPAKKAETVIKPVVVVSQEKTVIKSGQDEREQMYLFALRMMDARSYDVAQNALLKIKGYKNVDELLKQIEDKV